MEYLQFTIEKIPVPQVAAEALEEVTRLCDEHHLQPSRIFAGYSPECREWHIGSNYEEGWNTLIYKDGIFTWREPWEGTDFPAKGTPKELALQFVQQIVDV